jgi:hypothetical protein
MSANNRALTILRNIKDALNGPYADVDLVSLSFVNSNAFNFQRIALLLESIGPQLATFGRVVDETAGYISRQQRQARRFRIIMYIVMGFLIYGCIAVLYRYGNHPGPWHARAVYYMGAIIAAIIIILFVVLMLVSINARTERVTSVTTNDLVAYKVNLSDNIFIRYVNARIKGPSGVTEFRNEMVQQMQQDFDETNQFDFCSNNQDQSSMLNATCIVLDPCSPTVANETTADVLRRHFCRGARNPSAPCNQVLKQLFRSLQDVRDGSKITQLDRYFLWAQITQGVETIRSLMSSDPSSRADLALSGKRMLEIVKRDVLGTLSMDLVEVNNLAVPPSAPAEIAESAGDKTACWRACLDKPSQCKWAQFENGTCKLGTTDVVPGSVGAVFQYRDPPELSKSEDGNNDKSILIRGGKSLALLGAGRSSGSSNGDDDADGSKPNTTTTTATTTNTQTQAQGPGSTDIVISDEPVAYVCSSRISMQALNATSPLVYSGKLTIDTCAKGTDCGLVTFPNADATNSVPSVDVLKGTEVRGLAVSRGESYRVLFSSKENQVTRDKDGKPATFCRKTTMRDLYLLNPDRLVQTYQELEPYLKERIMFAMENYQFRLPLQTYRAYVLEKLRDFYGTAAFASLSPYILETLLALEKSVGDARKDAERSARYVTLQRFQARIVSMSSRRRNELSKTISDMSHAAYLHDRHFKPAPSNTTTTIFHTLLVYGILIVIVSCCIFLVRQFACRAAGSCSGASVVRSTAVLISCVVLIVMLAISGYKKGIIRREYNKQVADSNGRILVQKTAEMLQTLTGTSFFKLQVSLVATSGQVVQLATSVVRTPDGDGCGGQSNITDTTNTVLELAPNIVLHGLEANLPQPPGNLSYRAVRISLTSAVGTLAVRIRAVRVADVRGGFAYMFARPDASAVAVGQSMDLPVISKQAYYKAESKDVYDLQVFTSENVSDFAAVYSTGKTVIETFDKCNSLTQGMRDVPFPVADVIVMVFLVFIVLAVLLMLLSTLQPLIKVRNVRNLMGLRKKIRLGETAPEFDSLITCCKSGKGMWEQLMNIGVIIFFVFALYASLTLNYSTDDYRGGLYSSIEYSEGRCA